MQVIGLDLQQLNEILKNVGFIIGCIIKIVLYFKKVPFVFCYSI
jgi:hypothetical protein